MAYREFLRANGINPTDLSQKQYSDIINSQEMYHDDLVHFSNSDNCKEVRRAGEILTVTDEVLYMCVCRSLLNVGMCLKRNRVLCVSAIRGETERGEPRCGDRGVWLGLHSANSHSGQYAEQWPCCSLWKAQCGGPDHVH